MTCRGDMASAHRSVSGQMGDRLHMCSTLREDIQSEPGASRADPPLCRLVCLGGESIIRERLLASWAFVLDTICPRACVSSNICMGNGTHEIALMRQNGSAERSVQAPADKYSADSFLITPTLDTAGRMYVLQASSALGQSAPIVASERRRGGFALASEVAARMLCAPCGQVTCGVGGAVGVSDLSCLVVGALEPTSSSSRGRAIAGASCESSVRGWKPPRARSWSGSDLRSEGCSESRNDMRPWAWGLTTLHATDVGGRGKARVKVLHPQGRCWCVFGSRQERAGTHSLLARKRSRAKLAYCHRPRKSQIRSPQRWRTRRMFRQWLHLASQQQHQQNKHLHISSRRRFSQHSRHRDRRQSSQTRGMGSPPCFFVLRNKRGAEAPRFRGNARRAHSRAIGVGFGVGASHHGRQH